MDDVRPPEQERVLDQVATLFESLNFVERLDWCSRLKGWFDWDFTECADDLMRRAKEKGRWPDG